MEPVHIIGAGVSGLGAAHYLAKHNIPSVIHEVGEYYGGRAACINHEGHSFEIGGKNFSTAWTRFNALLDEFKMTDFEPQHPGFHIVMNDKLVALEKSKTLSGDLRLASEIGFRGAVQFYNFLSQARKYAPDLNYTSGLIEKIEQKWDHATIDKHFTRQLTDGPLRLFSIIMGAAEPSELYPSLLIQFASGFGKGSHKAIKGGVGQFHDNLAKDKNICLGSNVQSIEVENGQVKGLVVKTAGGIEKITTNKVISTVPAHILKNIVDLPAYARVAVNALKYHPLVLINAVYDGPVFEKGVHSVMFEPGSVLGHCSANRLDTPNHVRFTLSGKASREILDAPDDILLNIAQGAFAKRQPFKAKCITAHVARHTGGICGYAPYFSKVKKDLLRGAGSIYGLQIAGDYLEGHTMEGCLTSADLAVERLLLASAEKQAA